jgi:hypothetical protein
MKSPAIYKNKGFISVSKGWANQSRKLRLMTAGNPPPWPCDTPLSAKVGTNFGRHVAVAQSVQFACRLKAVEYRSYCKSWAKAIRSRKMGLTAVGDLPRWPRDTPYPQKLALNFVDKWRSISRYSSLAD